MMERKKVPKKDIPCNCLSLIMLSSVNITNKKYHTQTCLEECQYKIKENKRENFINDDFDASSSDESDNKSENECDNESNNESDNESNNDESNKFSKKSFKKSDNESDID